MKTDVVGEIHAATGKLGNYNRRIQLRNLFERKHYRTFKLVDWEAK